MTDANPTVDLTLFKSRNFTIGSIAFALGYAVFFANTLLLPLWLQTQLGYTATWAGLVAAPSGVVAVLLTPFVARLSGRFDARWLATVAFGSFALSYYLRAGYTTTASFTDFMLPLLVQGVAMSTFFSVNADDRIGQDPRRPVAVRDGNVELHANRRRQLCRLDHHDRLGIAGRRCTRRIWSDAIGKGVPYQMASGTLQQMGMTATQAAGAITRQMVGAGLSAGLDRPFSPCRRCCARCWAWRYGSRGARRFRAGPVAAD